MRSLPTDMGCRLVELRRARGLSQEELARRAGINAGYLSTLEKGRRLGSLETLLKLAAALQVDMADLFVWPARGGAHELRETLRTGRGVALRSVLGACGLLPEPVPEPQPRRRRGAHEGRRGRPAAERRAARSCRLSRDRPPQPCTSIDLAAE